GSRGKATPTSLLSGATTKPSAMGVPGPDSNAVLCDATAGAAAVPVPQPSVGRTSAPTSSRAAQPLRRCPRAMRTSASIPAGARSRPRGVTMTYGEIAAKVGAPGAAQAVGQAMGHNPFPIVVPCHRVVAAGGANGGFSAPGGVDTKLRLLAIEGATLF